MLSINFESKTIERISTKKELIDLTEVLTSVEREGKEYFKLKLSNGMPIPDTKVKGGMVHRIAGTININDTCYHVSISFLKWDKVDMGKLQNKSECKVLKFKDSEKISSVLIPQEFFACSYKGIPNGYKVDGYFGDMQILLRLKVPKQNDTEAENSAGENSATENSEEE